MNTFQIKKNLISNVIIGIVILVALIFLGVKLSGSRTTNVTDTAKIGIVKMIDAAFQAQLQAGKDLPFPDDALTITVQDQVIGYQGYVGSNVQNKVDFLSNKDIDTKSYLYFLDPTKTKYQLMTWIDKEDRIDPLSTGEDYIIVGDLENKEPYFGGQELGMFFETFTHIPMNEVIRSKSWDIIATPYPFMQRYTTDKIIQTNPRVLMETNPDFDATFRDKLNTKEMANLVGYRKFNEGNGTIVHDFSQYANHGQITGQNVSWITKDGRPGLQFGGGGWVQIPDSDSLDLTDNFTIVVEFEKLGEIRGTLISKDDIGKDSPGAYNVYTDTKVGYEINNKQGEWVGLVTPETYNKIVIHYQEGKASIRQDGKLILDNKNMPNPYILKTDILFGRRGVEDTYLEGIIHTIRIYNHNTVVSSNK